MTDIIDTEMQNSTTNSMSNEIAQIQENAPQEEQVQDNKIQEQQQEPQQEKETDNAQAQDTKQEGMSGAIQDKQEQVTEYEFKDSNGEIVDNSRSDVSLVSSLSKELNLSQEQAQKLFSIGGEQLTSFNNALIERAKQQWINDVINDEQLGGANYNATKHNVTTAIKNFADNDFKNVLIQSGIAEHPSVVRFLNNVGKAYGQDNEIINSNTTVSKKSKYAIYDNSPELFNNN